MLTQNLRNMYRKFQEKVLEVCWNTSKLGDFVQISAGESQNRASPDARGWLLQAAFYAGPLDPIQSDLYFLASTVLQAVSSRLHWCFWADPLPHLALLLRSLMNPFKLF